MHEDKLQAAEHLIDGSEKRSCQLNFEFLSPHVIERRSKSVCAILHSTTDDNYQLNLLNIQVLFSFLGSSQAISH